MLATPDNHAYSYLFDCGTAAHLTVGDMMRTKVLFVSHTHADHFSNFDFLLRNRAGSRDPVIVVGPKNISRNVQGKFQSYTWNLISASRSYFEVREIIDEQTYEVYRLHPPKWEAKYIETVNAKEIFRHQNISVETCVLTHHIPSIAYKMKEDDHINIEKDVPWKPGPWITTLKKTFTDNQKDSVIDVNGEMLPTSVLYEYLHRTPGYKLGFAMDHLGGGENHEKLKVFFKEIDELYIEAFFRQVDLSYATRHHHSTAHLSGKLARDAKVKRLRLIHHSRRYIRELYDLLEEGYAAFEGREPHYKHKPEARF